MRHEPLFLAPRIALPALLLPLLLAALPARADSPAKVEIGIAGMLGVGDEGTYTSEFFDTEDDPELDPTGGFGVHALYEVLPYLDVGGRVAALWWQADEAWPKGTPMADHGTLVDIDALFKGKYRLLDDRLEVYGKVPVGLTVSVVEELRGVTEGRTGVGANVGVLAGASWTFLKRYGIFLEFGYSFHWMKHEGKYKDPDFPLLTAEDTQKFWAHEFALNLGLLFRL